MKATHIWLTVLTIALVFNAVMMRTPAEGDECNAGIRKEHLDSTPGAFVDATTIEIGSNGLQIVDGSVAGDVIADRAITNMKVDSVFGGWRAYDSNSSVLVKNAIYYAVSDGFVTAYASESSGQLLIKTNSSSSPSVVRIQKATNYGGSCIMCPVKKGQYWKIECPNTPTIYWFGVGDTNAPVKQ